MSTHDDIFLQAMDSKAFSDNRSQNTILTGKVISESDNEYFLSVGGKSEMILSKSESIGPISVGDQIDIVSLGFKEGVPQASQKKANSIKTLESIYEAYSNKTPVEGEIIGVITNKEGQNAGFEVSIDGVSAFLPLSHIRTPKNIEELIKQSFVMGIIKCEQNRIVVSERIMREDMQKELFSKFIDNYKEGDELSSITVDTVEDSYAIVIAEGIRMFMHITEFDWKFIKNLKDVLKKGDQFPVRIKQINLDKKSIKVSRKAVIENPFDVFINNHKVGDNIKAQVVRFVRSAAIVEAEVSRADMFLPIGEMSWTTRVVDPKRLLNIGDRIEVKILNIDVPKKQIAVSLRDLLENPWDNANHKYTINTKHEGHITSITEFGLFVVFDDGIQGLIRGEDIDWANNKIDLNQKFKKGDPITATVLHIEANRERLRLGIKQLSENPYQNFANNHEIGSIISAKIVNLSRDRIDVEVEGGIKAFIHISQVSMEHINDINDMNPQYKIGDEIKASIRRINVSQQRIELSIKDMSLAEEKSEMANLIKSHKVEIPTLGSVFKDILK